MDSELWYVEDPQKAVIHAKHLFDQFGIAFAEGVKSILHEADRMDRVKKTYSRLLFEYAFYRGDTFALREALQFDPKLQPEQNTSLAFLVQVNTGSPPFSPSNPSEVSLRSMDYTILKDSDTPDWQAWRLKGIVSGQYERLSFPVHQSMYFLEIGEKSAFMRTNQHKEEAENTMILVWPGREEPLSIDYIVRSQHELDLSQRYRFEVHVDFPTKIEEKDVDAIFQAHQEKYISPNN